MTVTEMRRTHAPRVDHPTLRSAPNPTTATTVEPPRQVVGTTASPRLVRILLVDDHPMYLEGLRAAIETESWRVVVGAAHTGRDAVLAARTLRPDVVILDVNLPDASGFDIARRFGHELPATKVLMLTMEEDIDTALECVRAGVLGYLLKGASSREIINTLEIVSQGHAVLAPEISQKLLDHMTSPAAKEEPFPDLTSRERAVLELMADGRRNAAIAVELGLSLKTVRNYVSRIFVKIQVADRAEAVVVARRAGLGK